MKLLKYENNKLKQQFIFNLPVSKAICGRSCPDCYALKAQIRFANIVVPYREARYQASLKPTFTATMINELTSTRRSARTVRIHESGEFYSQVYIDKWLTIAKALPQFTFYAFTKRVKDFDFIALMSLPNVVIIDSMMHSRLNYNKLERLNSSIYTCPATTQKNVRCGIDCRYCMTKTAQYNGVQFVKH